jgi:hypothetical protein
MIATQWLLLRRAPRKVLFGRCFFFALLVLALIIESCAPALVLARVWRPEIWLLVCIFVGSAEIARVSQ